MARLCLTSLVGLAIAATIAWRVGGNVGAGVLTGFLAGASMSGLGALYQRHVLLTRPERFMAAMVVSFAAKLVIVLVGALSFRFVDAAAARIDWIGFLIAFAATVSIVLPIGAADAVRDFKRRAAAAGLDPATREVVS